MQNCGIFGMCLKMAFSLTLLLPQGDYVRWLTIFTLSILKAVPHGIKDNFIPLLWDTRSRMKIFQATFRYVTTENVNDGPGITGLDLHTVEC